MLKTFEIILDIEKELYTPSNLLFNISTNDLETVELSFLIQQDGANFDLTGNTVELAIKKPSGLTVYQEAEISDAAGGEAKVKLSLQSYNEYGIYTAEVYIRNLDQLAVTSRFYYGSTEAIMNDDTLESTNDWSAFLEVLFSYDKKPLVVDGVPNEFPEYIGQMAVDTVGQRAFIAYDLSGTGWQLIASGGEGGGGGLVYWTDILGKPTTFAPAEHTHEEYLTQAETDLLYLPIGTETGGGAPAEHTHEMTDVIGLTEALAGKADNADLTGYAPADHVHTFDEITNKPTTYNPAAHTHIIGEVEGLTAALEAKADEADLAAFQPKGDYLTAIPAEYLTETEAGALFQPIGTYLTAIPAEYLTQAEGDARYAIKGTEGGTVAAAWGDIAGTLANQTDLQAALDAKADDTDLAAKADSDHTHEIGEVVGLQAELDSKLEAMPAHTHTTGEITDFAAGVAAAIPANYLTEEEAANIYQLKGTYLTAIPPEYLTETEANALYQPIGTYLTAVPAEYMTETEANAAFQAKGDYLTTIPAEYLTETEGDARYMAKGETTAPAAHTHDWADITGEPTTLAGYGITDAASDVDLMNHADWQNSEIARLEGDIATKADEAHTHTAAEITDFAAGVAANIPAEYLTETEAGALYQPKGTYLTAVPAEYLTETEAGALYQPKGDYLTAIPAHTHTTGEITDFAAGVAANIPAEYLTETEGNAVYAKTANVYSRTAVDTALAGKANTTHTHTTANITDFAAGVAAAIPAEYLTATEGAAAYQPKGTYLTAVPLASAAAVGGGRVGNGLGMTGEYLHVKTGAGLGINATNYALQVQTVNAAPTPLNFWTGTAAEYAAVTKDANTLYFVTG